MFGIKWLWKSNKTNIDTSNFVSKEFLNTTLQDYVLNNSLNTTLTNYLTTNTAQTITGAKTFTEGVIINKNPVPLTLKSTDNNKNYIVYKDSANNSNLSIGANATSSSIEVNRGDLEIETQQGNKNISINTGRVKFNRSVVEFGTEINAGYGGATVKFIPEDNSTKTLQFYNSAATDTRRFNLLVPEPTAAQNPATKNYVDTQIGNIDIPSGISITKTQFQLSGGSVIGVGTADAFTAANGDYGLALPNTIDINKVLNITLTLPAIRDAGAIMNYSLTYSYGLYNNVARIVVMVRKNGYAEPAGSLNLAGTTITVLTYSEGGN